MAAYRPTRSCRKQHPAESGPPRRSGCGSRWRGGTAIAGERHPQSLGAAGEVEFVAQRAFVGAKGNISAQGDRIGLLSGGIAALALTDAGAGVHDLNWQPLDRPQRGRQGDCPPAGARAERGTAQRTLARRGERKTHFASSTCSKSSSTGVARPKIDTPTLTLALSKSSSSTIPLKLANGPSSTLTESPIS